MATVTFDRATRLYSGGDRPAVDALDLHVPDGEFLVLVGPSGCGKSTSLRMVAGLEGVDEGDILIGGEVVSHLPPKARDIAMVFQNYALYPHMTVAQNMGFALKVQGFAKSEIERRVRAAAALLRLEDFLDRRPRALSGGQRQRVAMGRALVREPRVFLMDEPLSNLDAKLRVQTRSEIAALQARLGTTTIYVTHDQVEAMTMGHRVAVMLDGVLQQADTPRSLYDRPANVFVAGFIGSPAMNLKTVELTEQGGRFGSFVFALTPDQRRDAGAGGVRTVVVGFRPEDVDIVTAGGGEEIEVIVDLVEELGSDSYVYAHSDVDDGNEQVVTRTDGRHAPTLGQTIAVRPRPDRLHVFHSETGLRLPSSGGAANVRLGAHAGTSRPAPTGSG